MSCLTLAVALGLTVGAQQPTAQQQTTQQPIAQHPTATGQQNMKSTMDGTWTVLCCEKNGQKMGSGQHENVTIQGGVLTCKIDGKEHRAHLMFGPNHMLTASVESPQQGSNAQNKEGKVGNEQPATTPGAPARNNPGQAQADGRPNQQVQPGVGGGQLNVPRQAPHHGVYIATNDFLCLALDQPFMEEEQKHAATGAGKTGTPAGGPLAGRPNEQGTNQPAPTAQPPAQPGANPVAGRQQPAEGAQPGSNLPVPGGQAGADLAERIRKAGYGPGVPANQQTQQQFQQQPQPHGFVLILQREGNAQQRGR